MQKLAKLQSRLTSKSNLPSGAPTTYPASLDQEKTMKKMLAAAILVVAGVQYLPVEFLIVLSLVPVSVVIGRPIARVVESRLTHR